MSRRKNGEATRQAILDVAMRLFGEQGYHHTSISAVADEAGVYRSSVAFYFGNKEDLLAGVYRERVHNWLESMAKRVFVEVKTDDHAEVMRSIIRLYMEDYHADPISRNAMMRVAMETKHILPELYASTTDHYLRFRDLLEMFVWSGQKAGGVDSKVNAAALAKVCVLTLLGCQSALYLLPELGTAEEHLGHLHQMLERFLLARVDNAVGEATSKE